MLYPPALFNVCACVCLLLNPFVGVRTCLMLYPPALFNVCMCVCVWGGVRACVRTCVGYRTFLSSNSFKYHFTQADHDL